MRERLQLQEGARVAVIGGGPAGAFFTIDFLDRARELGRHFETVIFERRRASDLQPPGPHDGWKGCNYCAGGISPKLNDALKELKLDIPEHLVQSRIHSITIQGFWKNIELEVPAGRELLTVYRGSRPDKRVNRCENFDAFLLDQALNRGAGLIAADVQDVVRTGNGKLKLRYSIEGRSAELEADFVVVAAGINEQPGVPFERSPMLCCVHRLLPGFAPPQVRQALIFELEFKKELPPGVSDGIHFVEYGSKDLLLEMCSIVPKRGYLTVVLVGPAVDALPPHSDNHRVIADFLKLPHVRKLLPAGLHLHPACACRPHLILRSARNPFGDRVAAVGDIVTARLYKDGILSAHRTARALANTVLERGIDAGSLNGGYEPTLRSFRIDNRIASLVFLLHRIFFSSSVLSRVLYQAVITERKGTPARRRRLEKILWRIASGDDDYREIFRSIIHPAALWSVLVGGTLITARNYVTELLFGLDWAGVSRFTTGVAIERLEEKRKQFSRLMADASVSVPGRLEFERMYTIKVSASREAVLDQLGRFGDPDRGYFRPRWVRVERIAGEPNTPGCVIQYVIAGGALRFSLLLEQLVGGHMAVYRVQDGFARGGILVFEIEKLAEALSAVSIYVAFNFPRGRNVAAAPFWWIFRALFPAFMHDVLWNHSLCQLKNIAETAEVR